MSCLRTPIAVVAILALTTAALANDGAKDSALGLTYHETEHYRLGTDTDAVRAAEYKLVLEACWPLFEEFFGCAPKLKKGERLNVYFLETQEGWQAKMKEDGVGVPVGAGGYYAPGTKAVYLWKQPTLYTSRQLLIHEAMHQFHYLACCNNVGPKDVWYIEGVVEHFSRHYWDGEKLTLGVIPFCSLEDYPRLALDLFSRDDFDLGAMISGERASTRPEQWALVRYLLLEGDAKTWKSLCKKLDGGQEGRSVFKKLYGDPAKLQPKIRDWLATQREPFVWVWNEWQGQGPNAVMGWAATSYSMCRTLEPATSMAADVRIGEGNWQGGVLAYIKDTTDYAFFMVDQAGNWIVTRGGNAWSTMASGKVEAKAEGAYRLKAERAEAALKLSIDGVEVGSIELPPSPMGVCLRNCTLRFANIEWR
jgi:hypothetical protein